MAEIKYLGSAALAQIAAEVKAGDTAVENKIGVLDNLTTTAKGSAVLAINEIDAAVKAVDYSGKADKVTGATKDNFAGLDENGNLVDSGKKAADFEEAGAAAAVQGSTTSTVKDVVDEIGTKKTADAAATGMYKYIDDAVEAVDSTTANAIQIKTDVTTEGALKSYTIYQGGDAETNKIGVIDIPKDFLVKSGSIVKDPAGQPAGTYIELVINVKSGTATDEKIYINVADLVDAYTAQQNATQVQLAVSDTNEISATIVAKSITATELADAVNTDIAKGQSALDAIGKASKAESAPGAGDGEAATGLTKRIEDLETSVAGADTHTAITTTEVITAFHPAP